MTAIATTVAQLGIGDYDSQRKILKYGPLGTEERIGMMWRPDVLGGVWISDPYPTFEWRDAWKMGGGATPLPWRYLGYPPWGSAGRLGQASYSWNPIPIRAADAAFATGVRFQERILCDFWSWVPTDLFRIATVHYSMNPNDSISNATDPSTRIGITVDSLPGQRRWHDTGWLDSGVQSSPKANIMPHLYIDYITQTDDNFQEWFWSWWRWIGDPTP